MILRLVATVKDAVAQEKAGAWRVSSSVEEVFSPIVRLIRCGSGCRSGSAKG